MEISNELLAKAELVEVLESLKTVEKKDYYIYLFEDIANCLYYIIRQLEVLREKIGQLERRIDEIEDELVIVDDRVDALEEGDSDEEG